MLVAIVWLCLCFSSQVLWPHCGFCGRCTFINTCVVMFVFHFTSPVALCEFCKVAFYELLCDHVCISVHKSCGQIVVSAEVALCWHFCGLYFRSQVLWPCVDSVKLGFMSSYMSMFVFQFTSPVAKAWILHRGKLESISLFDSKVVPSLSSSHPFQPFQPFRGNRDEPVLYLGKSHHHFTSLQYLST